MPNTGYPQNCGPPELVERDREQNEHPVIQKEAVSDLLCHLDAYNSMRLDWTHPGVMRELVEELTNLLFIIHHQSCLTGDVPHDWKLSSVTPVHKKGQKVDPDNYRSVRLTLVACPARL